MSIVDEIKAERERQQTVEGWTLTHDDSHMCGEMAGAAACYIMHGITIGNSALSVEVKDWVYRLWPWARHWWKPKDRRRDLVRAAALIVAEIERLDRRAIAAAIAAGAK